MSAPLRRLWWLDPAWLFAAVIGGTMLMAALQSDAAYRLYGTPKYLDGKHVLLAAVAILVFALGRQLAAATGGVSSATPRESDRVVRLWFWLTSGLTLFGYAVWVGVGIKNGYSLSMLLELLTGDNPTTEGGIRDVFFPTIPGVTTCTQFGVPAILLGLWLFLQGERRVAWPMATILALAAVRALVWGERLAAIELVVPGFLVWLKVRVLGRSLTPRVRAGLQLAPVLGIVMLVLFFGGAEYFRSWRYHQRHFDSFAEFTMWRIGGYYTTAHNNGAMAVEMQQPYPLPYWTVQSIWNIPGQKNSPFAYAELTRIDPDATHLHMLERYATPEMNNEGGLFMPVLDFGEAGYFVFWFGCGFVAGRLYRSFLAGGLAGLTLYPLVFLAILETPRFLYLSSTRAFPVLVALLVVSWLAPRVTRRAPAASLAPGSLEGSL